MSLGDKIILRPMELADLDQVRTIDRQSFRTPWPESSYLYELTQNPSSLLWVAEVVKPGIEREVVGMVVVWLILDEAHIATIAVRYEYRGREIGKRLLAVALKESINRGARQAMLEVRASNTVAQNLYRQFGFEIVGVRPHYYRDNQEDAVLMNVMLQGIKLDYLQNLEKNWLVESEEDETKNTCPEEN